MTETKFKEELIDDLREEFQRCIILKNDPSFLQGVPDLIILWHNKWAVLEVKKRASAPHRPNQDYYVDLMDRMSFARFIYPENKEEVLDELSKFFMER